MTDVAQQNFVEPKEENILTNRSPSFNHGEAPSQASIEALQQSNVENKLENETEEDKEIRKEIEQKMEARRTLIRKECMGSKKRLDLGFSNIDDLDAYTIAMCLNEKEPILELLHLGANKLSGEGLRVILTGLQWHIKLKELYLGNNKIDHEGIEDFIEILPIFQDLQMLGIGNIGLDDNLGVLLGSSLGCLPNLKSVVLNTNNLSDQTFVKLSTLLSENQLTCSTLHIGDNKPTAVGLVALFQSLENNKTVKNLHINDMYVGGDAVRALNKMLVKNTTLEQLNLGNCEIEDEAISLMKFGLMCNQTLKSLYLWGNKITNEGAYLMKMILEDHNFGLTALMLSNNYIDDEEIQNEIKLLLKRNEKLESIQKAANGGFQVLEAVMNLKNEQDNNTIIEHQNKAYKIQVLDKEIKEAERKIEEAKRELIFIKETLEPSMNKEDEKTRKD